MGWGIDGPVGTDFKMDALCLSQQISVCRWIESLNAIYHTKLLMSEHVKICLSETSQK